MTIDKVRRNLPVGGGGRGGQKCRHARGGRARYEGRPGLDRLCGDDQAPSLRRGGSRRGLSEGDLGIVSQGKRPAPRPRTLGIDCFNNRLGRRMDRLTIASKLIQPFVWPGVRSRRPGLAKLPSREGLPLDAVLLPKFKTGVMRGEVTEPGDCYVSIRNGIETY